MSQYIEKLEELYRRCHLGLVKRFKDLGICSWGDGSVAASGCRGGALFARFDSWNLNLHVFARAPDFFQALIRGNRISIEAGTRLSKRLLDLCIRKLPDCGASFTEQLSAGIVGEFLRCPEIVSEPSYIETQSHWFPDALFSAMPWPFVPSRHLTWGYIREVTVDREKIAAETRDPIHAIAFAADLCALGHGLDLNTDDIETILDWIEDRGAGCSIQALKSRTTATAERVIIPHFSDVFQGVTIGFFQNLPEELRGYAISSLQQFGETIASGYASCRRQEFLDAAREFPSLKKLTQAFTKMVSPVECIALECGEEAYACVLSRADNQWGGYDEYTGEAAIALMKGCDTAFIESYIAGRTVRIAVRPVQDCQAYNSLFALARIVTQVDDLLLLLNTNDRVKTLKRSEIYAVKTNLECRLRDGHGSKELCKQLYVIDLVHRFYTKGKAVITNSHCLDFTRKTVSSGNVKGYQVCGEALTRLRANIEKLLPSRFVFEPRDRRSALVRWRPTDDEFIGSA